MHCSCTPQNLLTALRLYITHLMSFRVFSGYSVSQTYEKAPIVCVWIPATLLTNKSAGSVDPAYLYDFSCKTFSKSSGWISNCKSWFKTMTWKFSFSTDGLHSFISKYLCINIIINRINIHLICCCLFRNHLTWGNCSSQWNAYGGLFCLS